ncbi:MAG: DUF2812 domain-containing protein [Oscillospiraceae bacterium]
MEAYLQDMSQQGWRLKWCRGILAGFEQEAGEPVRYAVDPYAMTSLIHFRRYPGSRLYERMQEGWTGAGRSKGCQILRTTNTSLQSPVPAEDQTSLIRNTCRLASLLIVLFILGMGGFLLSKPAVVYTLILRICTWWWRQSRHFCWCIMPATFCCFSCLNAHPATRAFASAICCTAEFCCCCYLRQFY